jgi:hypothetical protein
VKREKMKKIIAIGVVMAVILVLASAGPVAATNSSGTLVEPGDPDRGLQSAPLVGPGPIGYINTNSAPFFCDIWEYAYIDVNQVGLVSVGDVRLTDVTFGGITYVAGTQVANGDVDLGKALTALGPAPVGPGLPATVADLRLTNVNRRGQNYAFGTKVKTLDEDMDLMPRAIWAYLVNWQLHYIDNVGPGAYGLGDTVYIKLPATHFVPNIMTCDLRLTGYPY